MNNMNNMTVTIEIDNHEDIKQNNSLLKKKRKQHNSTDQKLTKKQNDSLLKKQKSLSKKKKNTAWWYKTKNKHGIPIGKEYYTLYEDINEQMEAAKDVYEFRNATVLCNCDNPLESNFFSYFVKNFHKLGLKKFICTCYKKDGHGLKIELDQTNFATIFGEDFQTKPEGEQDKIIAKFRENEKKQLYYITEMEGDGDCLSTESLNNLKKSDIVITNPPFGKIATQLVREIVKEEKKFVLICEIHDILGFKNTDLYNNEKYKIDFGKNQSKMCFVGADKEKHVIQGAKWINNIGIFKNDHKGSNIESENIYDKDRVRKILDAKDVYAIPNANLGKTLDFVKQVYSEHGNDSIISIRPSLFYNKNPIFNKENFDIIGVSDEVKKLNDGKQSRSIYEKVERRKDSPKRKGRSDKSKHIDEQKRLYYKYDGGKRILCKKKENVNLNTIQQGDKTLNLANANKVNFFNKKENVNLNTIQQGDKTLSLADTKKIKFFTTKNK